jgi:tetratricopeptide (TPR) repeat protein
VTTSGRPNTVRGATATTREPAMRNHAITALLGLTCCLTACKEDPAEAHHRVAVEAFAKGEFAKAAAAYEEVIKLNPDLDERVQKKAASAWAKAEEYEKAAALLERLAAKKTGDEKIASELEIAGMYLQTARDLDQAERTGSRGTGW